MTPERRAAETAEMSRVFQHISNAMAQSIREDMERTRYFYLGYTRLEESMWKRFNRCCHAGRPIKIKERDLFIRIGDSAVAVRRPVLLQVPA